MQHAQVLTVKQRFHYSYLSGPSFRLPWRRTSTDLSRRLTPGYRSDRLSLLYELKRSFVQGEVGGGLLLLGIGISVFARYIEPARGSFWFPSSFLTENAAAGGPETTAARNVAQTHAFRPLFV